jgi:hypothetical protein
MGRRYRQPWELRFELFAERGRFDSHFIETEISSPYNQDLLKLKENIDLISFQLFCTSGVEQCNN